MLELKDKVGIITGSSRGLGKILAMGFAREGAKVVVAARTEVEKELLPGTIYKTAEAIKAEGGYALPIKCDVTSEESVGEMVKRVLDELGRIDILVNNAGTAFPKLITETSLKRWELVLKVNLTGAFLCSRGVLPGMIAGKSGSIINITSIDAIARSSGFAGAAYGVSKAALERFTWSLAAEVGKYNIAVNALKPREGIETEGLMAVSRGVGRERWESPEKFVRAAIFLAKQDASGVTGTVASDEEYCLWHGLE
ncbi:MAG TPA: SDR family NAD(P)-dependent oxidoreductase [Dehalococcoidales bacterium]|nr:SDR family NAD(P)-dependent oxidoreductase [Dehalococcoidales bacterium]